MSAQSGNEYRRNVWEDPTILLRIPEAAERLGIGRSTVYQLMDAGQLPYVRIGRSRRIQLSAVSAFVRRATADAGSR